MNKSKIYLAIIGLIIIASVFAWLGNFNKIKEKLFQMSSKIGSSPQPKPIFKESLLQFHSVNLEEKTITGELVLPKEGFTNNTKETIFSDEAFYKKNVVLKIEPETLFYGTNLDEIKEGDFVQVETKESLLDYSDGELTLVSVKK